MKRTPLARGTGLGHGPGPARRPGTALSQGCGKRRFASPIAAEKAAGRGLAGSPAECLRGGLLHWHLVIAPARTVRAGAGGDIPRAVRGLLRERDPWCVRCGIALMIVPHSLHHRLRRSQGADHTAPNLLGLCGSGSTGCHGWVHAHPAEARAHGWLLLSGQDPARHSADVAVPGGFERMWLLPDGTRTTEAPEGIEAA